MNSSPDNNNQQEGTKKCNACKQEIYESAKLCYHCNSAQGLSRHVSVISLYVGTLIAVVSIATIGYESALKLFSDEKADIAAHVINIEEESFNLAISNRGSKPGVIYDLLVDFPLHPSCKRIFQIKIY